MLNVPTESEQALIKKYVENQEFKNKETKQTITDIMIVLISLGLSMKKTLNNVDAIIAGMKREYEEEQY